jgi:ATP-binding cassette subfamily C (CFTR/MRP) protein 1
LGEKYSAIKVVATIRDQSKHLDQTSCIVAFQSSSFTHNTTCPSILNDITFEIQSASLTIIVGPVGSGKSSLLKAIIGELQPQSGQVSVTAGSISYCDQTPWIPNGTIRDTILGGLDFEQSWFDEVIRVCALEEDIEGMQNGIETGVDNRGIALSEGQKHRVVRFDSKFISSHELISSRGSLSGCIL